MDFTNRRENHQKRTALLLRSVGLAPWPYSSLVDFEESRWLGLTLQEWAIVRELPQAYSVCLSDPLNRDRS